MTNHWYKENVRWKNPHLMFNGYEYALVKITPGVVYYKCYNRHCNGRLKNADNYCTMTREHDLCTGNGGTPVPRTQGQSQTTYPGVSAVASRPSSRQIKPNVNSDWIYGDDTRYEFDSFEQDQEYKYSESQEFEDHEYKYTPEIPFPASIDENSWEAPPILEPMDADETGLGSNYFLNSHIQMPIIHKETEEDEVDNRPAVSDADAAKMIVKTRKRKKSEGLKLPDPEEWGFYRGLKPKAIHGATDYGGELKYLVEWEDLPTQFDLIPAKELNHRYPKFVINHYEKSVEWTPAMTAKSDMQVFPFDS